MQQIGVHITQPARKMNGGRTHPTRHIAAHAQSVVARQNHQIINIKARFINACAARECDVIDQIGRANICLGVGGRGRGLNFDSQCGKLSISIALRRNRATQCDGPSARQQAGIGDHEAIRLRLIRNPHQTFINGDGISKVLRQFHLASRSTKLTRSRNKPASGIDGQIRMA